MSTDTKTTNQIYPQPLIKLTTVKQISKAKSSVNSNHKLQQKIDQYENIIIKLNQILKTLLEETKVLQEKYKKQIRILLQKIQEKDAQILVLQANVSKQSSLLISCNINNNSNHYIKDKNLKQNLQEVEEQHISNIDGVNLCESVQISESQSSSGGNFFKKNRSSIATLTDFQLRDSLNNQQETLLNSKDTQNNRKTLQLELQSSKKKSVKLVDIQSSSSNNQKSSNNKNHNHQLPFHNKSFANNSKNNINQNIPNIQIYFAKKVLSQTQKQQRNKLNKQLKQTIQKQKQKDEIGFQIKQSKNLSYEGKLFMLNNLSKHILNNMKKNISNQEASEIILNSKQYKRQENDDFYNEKEKEKEKSINLISSRNYGNSGNISIDTPNFPKTFCGEPKDLIKNFNNNNKDNNQNSIFKIQQNLQYLNHNKNINSLIQNPSNSLKCFQYLNNTADQVFYNPNRNLISPNNNLSQILLLDSELNNNLEQSSSRKKKINLRNLNGKQKINQKQKDKDKDKEKEKEKNSTNKKINVVDGKYVLKSPSNKNRQSNNKNNSKVSFDLSNNKGFSNLFYSNSNKKKLTEKNNDKNDSSSSYYEKYSSINKKSSKKNQTYNQKKSAKQKILFLNSYSHLHLHLQQNNRNVVNNSNDKIISNQNDYFLRSQRKIPTNNCKSNNSLKKHLRTESNQVDRFWNYNNGFGNTGSFQFQKIFFDGSLKNEDGLNKRVIKLQKQKQKSKSKQKQKQKQKTKSKSPKKNNKKTTHSKNKQKQSQQHMQYKFKVPKIANFSQTTAKSFLKTSSGVFGSNSNSQKLIKSSKRSNLSDKSKSKQYYEIQNNNSNSFGKLQDIKQISQLALTSSNSLNSGRISMPILRMVNSSENYCLNKQQKLNQKKNSKRSQRYLNNNQNDKKQKSNDYFLDKNNKYEEKQSDINTSRSSSSISSDKYIQKNYIKKIKNNEQLNYTLKHGINNYYRNQSNQFRKSLPQNGIKSMTHINMVPVRQISMKGQFPIIMMNLNSSAINN